MEFTITPGINPIQYYIWLNRRTAVNFIADYIEQHANIEVTETHTKGRWVNPNLSEAGCIIVWHNDTKIHPQQAYNQIKWAVQEALHKLS